MDFEIYFDDYDIWVEECDDYDIEVDDNDDFDY